VDEALADVERALKECRSVSVWALPDTSVVDWLDRVQALGQQVAALYLALVREADGRGIPAGQGATGTAAWLRDRHRISAAAATRQVRLAAALHDGPHDGPHDGLHGGPHGGLPATAAALADGVVNIEQAHAIAAAVATLPAGHRPAGEAHLLGQATTFGPRELAILGQRLLEVVAPDEADQRALDELTRAEERAHHGRDLRLTDLPGESRVRLTGWLDRESAATIRAALDPLCAPRTTHHTTHHTEPGPDPRTPGQRRADALTEICRLATTTGDLPDNGGDRPQLVVTLNLDTLRTGIGLATLDDGAPLSAATARRLACDANLIPAVLSGPSQVLDLGRERRLITGPLRRALVLRDRGCAFPGCDRPPRWCDAHHITHWANGGPTNLNKPKFP
jgi:hypothetical protein